MDKRLLFAGSSGGSSYNVADSITTKDTVEVLLGVGLGPIRGLVNGPKTFYADQTPVSEFDDFELAVYPGATTGETVSFALGGPSLPIQVGQKLSKDAAVTRAGVAKGHNRVDFRIAIQQLTTSTSKGQRTAPLSLKFEYRKSTESAWRVAATNVTSTADLEQDYPPSGDFMRWVIKKSLGQGYQDPNSYSFSEDRVVLILDAAPTSPQPDRTLAWNKATQTLYVMSSGSWRVVPINSYRWADTDGVLRKFYPQLPKPIDPSPGDLWNSSSSNDRILIFNGVAWVVGGASQTQAGASQTSLVNGVWSTQAKVSSTVGKDIVVYIDADPNATYQYRVTKLSADSGTSGDDEVVSEIYWESIQEVSTGSRTFSGVALARIFGQASEQFTNLPNWSGDYDLKLVKIPSNYNPDTRVYSGVWDGTYKIDWTSNPAFCLQDLIENDEYGLSKMYGQTVDKWAFYEFGRYCDTMVPRPDGTMRPRWTYNDLMTEPREVKEACSYIAGAAGALWIDDGNGTSTVVIDQDRPAVALFTAENVSDEGFSYSYTDRLTRFNRIVVEFVNPDLNWENDKRVIEDADDVAAFGVIEENFVAVGCTDVDEAMARARRRLVTNLTEKEIVTFKTNRKGRYLSQWDVILVADPDVGRGLSGRIQSQISSTRVRLRDAIALEAGITYWATFEVPDETDAGPFKAVRARVSTGAGSVTELQFSSALPALPEYAVFTLEAEDVIGLPKPYRILSIGNDAADGETIEIEAIEINRNKWSFIDTGTATEPPDYSVYEKNVLPPTNLKITVSTRQVGTQTIYVLGLSWDRSASKLARLYKIYHSLDGVALDSKETTGTSIEFEAPGPGIHTFSIIAINGVGRESPPATITFDMIGEGRPVTGAFPLLLVGGTGPNTFDTLDASFMWVPPTPGPGFSHYLVEVIDPKTQTYDPATGIVDLTSGTVIHSDAVGQAVTWTYHFNDMQAEGTDGVPRREFRVNVYAVDQFDTKGDPATILVSNPAPDAPEVNLAGGALGFDVKLSAAEARDIAGVYVWVSLIAGFDPLQTPPVVDAANQRSFFLAQQEPGTYYVRAAYYDGFGKDPATLHISEQKSVLVNSIVAEIDGIEDLIRDALDEGVKIADEAMLRLTEMAARLAIREDLLNKGQHTADGLPLGPTVKEQKTITSDAVETLNLTVVKKEDRSGVILRQDKVELTDGQTLAQTFTRLEAQDADALAAVAAEQTARTEALEAEAASRLALQSVVNENKATAEQGLATLANQAEVMAAVVTQLSTDYEGNKAQVAQTLSNLSDADSAEALARLALASTVADNKALFDQAVVTLSSATQAETALREQLAATVGANKALFDQTVIALSNADSSEAIARQQLATTVGQNKAYVEQLAGTISTVDGKVNSFVGFQLGAGNKVVGWRAANNGVTGVIDFNFDAYILRKPDGTTLLQASGNTVRMPGVVVDTLEANIVTADKIVGGAVSTMLAFEAVGPMSFYTSGETTHLRFEYRCEGGPIALSIYGDIGTPSSAAAGAVIRLYCDNQFQGSGNIYCNPLWGGTGLTFPCRVSPGAGPHIFEVRYQATPGSGQALANRTYVLLTELKK